VGRIYAGVLGPLALLTVLGRGLLHGGGADGTLVAGWFALVAFAGIGYVVGKVAGSAVEASIRERLAAELAELGGEQRAGQERLPA
jgi:hypothetical protein